MVSSPQPRARLVALPSPTLAHADDGTLARAASSGDPRAASVMWDRFSPLVRRILRRTLGPNAEVEELVQGVFLRLLQKVGALPDSAALKPFVVGVTVRVLNSELRRRRMRRFLRLRPRLLDDTASLPVANADTALSALYRILDGLDAETRIAFTLRHFEGLQMTELASAMDASLASSKRRLARANARVQAAVSRDAALGAYAGGPALADAGLADVGLGDRL
jgi:RNA polymerase sigma-70 factor (ECF subfamily)